MSKSKYNIPGDGNCLFNSVLITYVDANDGNYPQTSKGEVITNQLGLRKLVSLYYEEHFEEVKDLLKNMLIDTIKLKNFAGLGKLYQQLNEIYNIYQKNHSTKNKEAYLEEAVNEELIKAYIQGIEDCSIWGGGSELDILSKLLLIKIKLAGQEHSFNSSGNDDVSEIEIQYTGGNHFNALILNPKNAVVAGIINSIKAEPNVKEHSGISKSQSSLLEKLSEKEFFLVMQIIFNKRELEKRDHDNAINEQEINYAIDFLQELNIIDSIKLQVKKEKFSSDNKKEQNDETGLEGALSKISISVSKSSVKELDEVDELAEQFSHYSIKDIASDHRYFPRCEYYTRFQGTTIFTMNDPEYWGTYFRSTSRGGNCDRYAKLFQTKDKTYENALINSPQKNADGKSEINSYHAKTGAFRSPFFHKKYKEIVVPQTKDIRIHKKIRASEDFLYDQILRYKQGLCEHFVVQRQHNPFAKVLSSYDNEYPCIMVSIPGFNGKGSIESWYQIAMSYFVAIANKFAVRQNVPIELVVRSSFSHNLPSIDSTGESFRINVGVVPRVYVNVLVQSLVELEGAIAKLQNYVIEKETIKGIDDSIEKYNKDKVEKQTLPTWSSTTWSSNLFKILDLKGDTQGKKVIAQITRKKEYLDLFIDLVMEELNQKNPNLAIPLIKMLKSISYGQTISLDKSLKYKFIDKKLAFQDGHHQAIQADVEFWKILDKVCKALGAEALQLQRQIQSKTIHGLYALLEEASVHFIRNSGYQEAEDGVGSDSECEGEDENLHFYSSKITVSTGMRAINLATFLSLYYITRNTDITRYKIAAKHMYYETEDAVSTVLNAFSGFFEVPERNSARSKKVAEILFFDLNHCNAKTVEVVRLEEMIGSLRNGFPIILDYTSATTDKICNSVLKCLRNTEVVLLVSSGLKNEQMSADINPYGTIRIVAKQREQMLELYHLAQEALERSGDILPIATHQIRKAYKAAGFVVTNKQIFGDRVKVVEHSHVGIKHKIFPDDFFNYWDFIEYPTEIEALKLLGFNKEEIINLYRILGGLEEIVNLIENFKEEVSVDDIKNLNTSELQRLRELFNGRLLELENLLKRKNIRDILSWDDDKIKVLGGSGIDDIIDLEQNLFEDIERYYDEDSDITGDLIKNGGGLTNNFQENFDRYQAISKQNREAEKDGSYFGDHDTIAQMEAEEAEEGCPEGCDVNSEMSSENECDSDDRRCSVPRNSNDDDDSDEEYTSEDEYGGFEVSASNFVGMTRRSIDLNLQLLSQGINSSMSQRVIGIKEFMHIVQPQTRYLIIDSELANVKAISKSDALISLPNVLIMSTGVQYDDYSDTKSCSDNALLSLAMAQGYRAYAVQLVDSNHLVTVIEYSTSQLDAITQKIMQITNGEYYIPDRGEESWNKYKEIFIGTSQLKLQEESLGALVLYDVRHSATESMTDFDVDSNSHIHSGSRVSVVSHKFYSTFEWYLKQIVYHKEINQFKEILQRNGIDRSIDILLKANSLDFKKSVLLKLHTDKRGNKEDFIVAQNLREKFHHPLDVKNLINDKIKAIQPIIHKVSMGFKMLDTVVDSVRFMHEPTVAHAKAVAFDSSYIYSMYYGVNSYASVITTVDVLYNTYHGEYGQALKQAATTVGYMALSTTISYMGIQYLGFVYGTAIAVYTVYSAVSNLYSLYQEYGSIEVLLKSITAYKDLSQTLSYSPLQYVYDFVDASKKYEMQINNIKLGLEKAAIKTQLEAQGEFGQKLYDYIYKPSLEEKYNLLNQVLQGSITEEGTENLKAKHIKITSDKQNYEHCMEIRDIGNGKSISNDESNIAEHYYCYNDEKEILDHIVVGSNNIQVIEHLL